MHLPTKPHRLVHLFETVFVLIILTAIPVLLAYHAGHAAVHHDNNGETTARPGSVLYNGEDAPRIQYGGYIKKTNTLIVIQDGTTYRADGIVGNQLHIGQNKPVTLKIVALNATTGALTVEADAKEVTSHE